MKKFALLIATFFVSLLSAAPTVTVSILPQKYFVEQITKDAVAINVMVQPGSSPHTYEPKPSQMKELASSDAYFSVGDGFEKAWLPKFQKTNPKITIVDTTKGIKKIEISGHHHHDDHKHDHKHEAGELDPHIWLDPILVKIQAKNIYDALIEIYPAQKEAFTKNFEAFMASIDELDKKISNSLQNIQSRKFIVFHPSFGYFAKRYNLEQIAIEVSGKEPKPAELSRIIKEAKEEKTKVIFVSPQFSQKSASQIAKEIGGKVVAIDPLAYQWSENLLTITSIFQTELK